MARSSRVVDDLDLQIVLSDELIQPLIKALAEYSEHHLHVEVEPKIKKNVLYVNSTDLISLLGYVNPSLLSEIESARLRKAVKQSLESQLLNALSAERQGHYKWCLTALKNLEMGRFLD